MIQAETLTLAVKETPQRLLPEGKPINRDVRFLTPAGNSGTVYLSSVQATTPSLRFPLPAGTDIALKVTDLATLYFYGTADDSLCLFFEEVENIEGTTE
jgi:hypothetical protein